MSGNAGDAIGLLLRLESIKNAMQPFRDEGGPDDFRKTNKTNFFESRAIAMTISCLSFQKF